MLQSSPWIMYCVGGLGLIWLGSVVLYWRHRQELPGQTPLLIALCLWPLILLDEITSAIGGAALQGYGLTDWVPVLVITLLYRTIKPSVIKKRGPSKWLLWVPLAVCIALQLPLALSGMAEKENLLANGPIGHPLDYWPVYAISMVSGFCMLIIGLLITETVQNYHRHLSDQVVDPQEYRLKYIASAMGITVGISVILILLVTAVTFGFLPIVLWQTGFHLILATALLGSLLIFIFPQRTAPCPLDYDRLDERQAEQAAMRMAIEQAEQVMLETRAYKKIGLTIDEFAAQAKLDPTLLAIATHLLLKKDFRQFVYHYRLEYAKNVLLRSDANIAAVAKKLGLHSEKFMGEVLVKHLRNLE